MSRALLAVALLVGGVRAHADPARPDPKPEKSKRAALKLAACSPDSPPLLIKPPADRQGSDAGQTQPPLFQLDRGNPDACGQALDALPDSTQIAARPGGPNGSAPSGPVTQEEEAKAFESKTTTLGALTARLGDFAQQHGIDDAVMEGRTAFDNARDAGREKARQQLVGALKQEVGVSQAAAEVPKDYPRPTTQQRLDDAKSPPAIPQEEDSGAEPGTTLSDIPFVGPAVNKYAPSFSDTPLNPRNWASSPPKGLQGPVNPNGTAVPPGLQPQGDKTSGAPIWAPFTAKLKACRPDCQPQQFGIWRPGDPTSCHHSGAAIDLHSIRCGDKLYKAIESSKDSGPFAELVTCMRSDKGGGHLFAIWHQCFKNCGNDKTSNHMDHTHLSIGCGHGRK